jgi:hypothetical protein
VILSDFAGLSAAGILIGLEARRKIYWTAAASVLLFLALLPMPVTGMLVSAQIFFGQIAASILLMRIMLGGSYEHQATVRTGLAHTTIAFGLSQILFVLLTFLYYAAFDISLGFRPAAILPAAGLTLFLPLIFTGRKDLPAHLAKSSLNPAAYSFIFVLAPLSLWFTWRTPEILAPPANGVVRVMTYNLHNGFSTEGRIDLEALAEVIEDSGAQVVGLQEISRGWVINGSVDMLSWLSQRLNMAAINGPTADPQWGNAILTRLPVAEVQLSELPPESLLLRRGYIHAEIRTGAGNLRVIVTHLHHIENGFDRRMGRRTGQRDHGRFERDTRRP